MSSEWTWCDAVEAIAAFITPFFGLAIVQNWFNFKREVNVDEEQRRVFADEEIHPQEYDTLEEFWKLIKDNVTILAKRKIPVRRFWNVPLKKGIRLVFVVKEGCAQAELYIDNGNAEWNREVYDKLKARKDQIEQYVSRMAIGKLIWFDRTSARAKGIGILYEKSGLRDGTKWLNIAKFFNSATPALKNIVI